MAVGVGQRELYRLSHLARRELCYIGRVGQEELYNVGLEGQRELCYIGGLGYRI